MASKTDHVLCVTCKTELPPETKIHYFAQSPLFPSKDDLGFGEELGWLLEYLSALCMSIGYGQQGEKINEELGRLGAEVAKEALRRLDLLTDAQDLLLQRADTLRKRLGEEEAA